MKQYTSRPPWAFGLLKKMMLWPVGLPRSHFILWSGITISVPRGTCGRPSGSSGRSSVMTPEEQAKISSIVNRFQAGALPAIEGAEELSRVGKTGPVEALYAADYGDWAYSVDSDLKPWKPSIFMPRWASRITLEITEVRVERVHEISEDDAKAEGIHTLPLQEDRPGKWWTGDVSKGQWLHGRTPVKAYQYLWESINHKRAAWDSNPWVWVVTFRRIES